MMHRIPIQRVMILAALCGILAAPSALQAQPSPGSTGTMAAPAEVFTKLLSGEEQEIVGAADAMPADKYSYAPTEGEFKGVRTFGAEIKHLAEGNYGMFATWNLPNMKTRADIEKLSSKEEIMQALRDSFTFAHAAMNTITADNAFEQMGEAKSTRAGTATHALAHMMDHYGQLVEYLRMNGIVPPASRKSAAGM